MATPSPRTFSARLNKSLGICLKQGESHSITCNGVPLVYPANCICVRFPGTIWSCEAVCVGFVSIDIDPEYFEHRIPERQIRFIAGAQPGFKNLIAAIEHGTARLTQELALAELVENVNAHSLTKTTDNRSTSQISLDATRTRRAIEDNFLDNPSLDDLASITGQNKFVLIRRFKQAMGISPHRYIINLRVAKARELLAKGISASEAAISVGFSDQAHLNRHFLRIVGMTPFQYARQKRFVMASDAFSLRV